jgi:hypothetical protein
MEKFETPTQISGRSIYPKFHLLEKIADDVMSRCRFISEPNSIVDGRGAKTLRQIVFFLDGEKIKSIYLHYGRQAFQSNDVVAEHIFHQTIIKYFVSIDNVGITERNYIEVSFGSLITISDKWYSVGNIFIYGNLPDPKS